MRVKVLRSHWSVSANANRSGFISLFIISNCFQLSEVAECYFAHFFSIPIIRRLFPAYLHATPTLILVRSRLLILKHNYA